MGQIFRKTPNEMMDYVQPLVCKRMRNAAGVEWVTYVTLDKYRERNCLPNYLAYLFLLTLMVSAWFFWRLDNSMPTQLTFEDEKNHPERFIGQRAELYLKRLTDIGPKVVGSYENEVLAVDMLKRDISFIAQQAKKIHKIEIDVQKPTGSYYLTLSPHTFKNYYENVQNVVVKFNSENSSSDSVLLNCHFDTVPESPGASDNGLNCAVLLEVLNKLSKSDKPLQNTVIFLFNGAEENPLQASHGFITQHKWRHHVKAVINLDAAGAGGREVLFQTTSNFPWLVQTYAKVALHPAGGVHGEELFLSGIIPSDTDFRIFRDYGKLPGLDFAHIGNGYVYHTKYDTMEHIDPGVIQNTGDNILALVREIAYSPGFVELSKPEREEEDWKVIYFDVFGLFMVVYTEPTALILNFATALFSFFTVYRTITCLPGSVKSSRRIIFATKQEILGWFVSSALVVLSAKITDWFSASMSWYNQPWLIMPLYFTMYIFANTILPVIDLGKLRGVKAEKKAILFIIGMQLIWTTILVLGTILTIRSSFVIMLLVFSAAISSAITTYKKRFFSARKYLIGNFICTLFPILFIIHQTVRLFNTLIPMTARMGPQSQPELVISALVVIMSVLIMSYWIPIVMVMRRPKEFMCVIIGVHFLTLMTVAWTTSGFPYSGDSSNPALQRFYIMHSERTFYDFNGDIRKMDSGFFVQSLDRNCLKYVSREFPELRKARSATLECATELNCGAPVFTARFLNSAPFGFWVDAYAPLIHQKTDLVVSDETRMNNRAKRINFVLTGPDHMTILISPKVGVRLFGWTFDDEEPRTAAQWMDRNIYMVYYSHGLMGGTLKFGVDLEGTKNLTSKGSCIEVVVISHYLNQRLRSEEFMNFLSRFPSWAHLTPWAVSYKSWIF